MCFHDLHNAKSIARSWSSVTTQQIGVDHIGLSSPGIALHLSYNDFPAGTKVIGVIRPIADVVKSYMDYFTRHPYPQFKEKLNEEKLHSIITMTYVRTKELLQQVPDPLREVVDFDRLSDVETGRRLWNFVAPEEVFNAERWKILDLMRIDPFSEKVEVDLPWA